MVELTHGANRLSVRLDEPRTAGSVLTEIRPVLNLPAEMRVLVNGKVVGLDQPLRNHDWLEVTGERGRKAVGKRIWKSAEAFCDDFGITDDQLSVWRKYGLRVIDVADGSIRITEDMVDEFFDEAALGEAKDEPQESPYMDTTQAAQYLRTTKRGIYGLIERGRLASLPGSRRLLFTKEMLDRFLRNE